MSSTTEQTQESLTGTRKIPRPPARGSDLKPWTSPEEHKGRHAIARGRGVRRPIRMSIEIDLDVEQSEWLHRECGRTGVDYDDIIKALIDRERAARP